ncbi:hypothetical protein [Salinarchaeum chitinilyticum]
MRRVATVAIAVLVLTTSVAVMASVAVPSNYASRSVERTVQTDAYAGTYVSFETSGSTVTNYSVGGTELFASAAAQSQSEYDA